MSFKKTLGFLAVAGLVAVAAPTGHAQAASLINPGVSAAVKSDSVKSTTEVRWHHRWHRRYWHHRRW